MELMATVVRTAFKQGFVVVRAEHPFRNASADGYVDARTLQKVQILGVARIQLADQIGPKPCPLFFLELLFFSLRGFPCHFARFHSPPLPGILGVR